MGLEAVREEIIRQAKEQENALIAEARREANKIIKETERKISDMGEKSEQETKKMIDIIKRQELASAELENKKMFLESKKEIIESVFADARKKLENLDDRKREAFIKKLLEKAKSDIEVATVYCSKKDARFVKGFKIETANIIGGLIAENNDKTVRVDYCFETMLQTIKENEIQNLNKVLFA